MKQKGKTILLSTLAGLLLVLVFVLWGNLYNLRTQAKNLYPTVTYKDMDVPENITTPMLDAFMQPYKAPIETTHHTYSFGYYKLETCKLLAGNKDLFAISVLFKANVSDPDRYTDWGTMDSDGLINCEWALVIHSIGANQYQLVKVLHKDEIPSSWIQNKDIPVHTVSAEPKPYKIESGKVSVTTDGGKNWISVPVSDMQAFLGYDSSGHRCTDLTKGRYVITADKISFLYRDGSKGLSTYRILQSDDGGQNWVTNTVAENVKMSLDSRISYTEGGSVGYAIIVSGENVRETGISLYHSVDGGKTWSPVDSNLGIMAAATGISFSDKNTGFITFRNDMGAEWTTDGGTTWQDFKLPVPEKFKGIFTEYTAPVFTGKHGVLLMGQGDSGDYESGEEMARFLSDDGGLSWRYDTNVFE